MVPLTRGLNCCPGADRNIPRVRQRGPAARPERKRERERP